MLLSATTKLQQPFSYFRTFFSCPSFGPQAVSYNSAMPEAPTKAVRVHELIGAVLDAYCKGGDAKRQFVAGAALFLYFALPDSFRPTINAFYQGWLSQRGQHFHADKATPGPPLVGLDFDVAGMPEMFLRLLERELRQTLLNIEEPFPDDPAESAPGQPSPSPPAPKAKARNR
jgi:hypothetical protein